MDQLFSITKLDRAAVEKVSLKDNDPHIHDNEELLIGVEGEIEHFIDFRMKKLRSPFISFVAQGKAHLVKPQMKDGRCDIWMLQFKSEFIPETTFQLYSYYHEHANISMAGRIVSTGRAVVLCEMMAAWISAGNLPIIRLIRHLLNTLFIMIESGKKKT